MNIEKTLVLIKPDGVKRGLMGKILQRFEDAGMKIVGVKMRWTDPAYAKRHYTDDITKRRGEKVRNLLIDFISSGPVLAFVIEGVNAIENVRKIVGATEPKAAVPGTIRGDFSHVSYAHADEKGKAVENVIHASANREDAEHEIWLWFNKDEVYNYQTVYEQHTF